MRVPCSCGILGFSAAIAASFTAAPKTMETLTLISPHIRKSIRSTAVVNPHPTSTTQARFISYFKQGKKNTAGHNSAGRITSFHRGGGAKRVFRKIDYKRTTSSVGIVERIEYDPNRSSRIALVRWIEGEMFRRQKKPPSPPPLLPPPTAQKLLESSTASVSSTFAFSSLPGSVDGRVCASDDGASSCLLDSLPRIAVAGAKPAFFTARKEEPNGKETFSLSEIQKWGPQSASWAHRLKRKAALSWRNLGQREGDAEYKVSKPNGDQGKVIPSQVISYAFRRSIDRPIEASGLGIVLAKPKPTSEEYSNKLERAPVSYISASHQLEVGNRVVNYDGSKGSKKQESLDLNFQVGNCMPLADIRLGTWVHDIELHPGQGAKLTRAAGTFAKVVKEPSDQCLVRLPSGREKLIDSRCRATIGVVSNPTHGARKLRKAGHSRWLGRRPVVRGIAMNPVDHPHGGGEGRTKGGRPSVSPWGKPTKAGFKTAAKSKRDRK